MGPNKTWNQSGNPNRRTFDTILLIFVKIFHFTLVKLSQRGVSFSFPLCISLPLGCTRATFPLKAATATVLSLWEVIYVILWLFYPQSIQEATLTNFYKCSTPTAVVCHTFEAIAAMLTHKRNTLGCTLYRLI